jgi:hypothetical protein
MRDEVSSPNYAQYQFVVDSEKIPEACEPPERKFADITLLDPPGFDFNPMSRLNLLKEFFLSKRFCARIKNNDYHNGKTCVILCFAYCKILRAFFNARLMLYYRTFVYETYKTVLREYNYTAV